MKQKNIDLHNCCHCEIRWRMFKGKSDPTPGLFCRNHDIFLDWLKTEDANLLIDNGIQESPYLERKKSKKIKHKTPSFIKWTRKK
jgi:hypothetical protein